MGVVQEVSKLEPLKYVPSCYPIPEKKLDKYKYKRPITQGHEASFCPTYLFTKFPSANLAAYIFRYSIWLILIVSVCNRKSMWPIYVVSLSVSTSASSTRAHHHPRFPPGNAHEHRIDLGIISARTCPGDAWDERYFGGRKTTWITGSQIYNLG